MKNIFFEILAEGLLTQKKIHRVLKLLLMVIYPSLF